MRAIGFLALAAALAACETPPPAQQAAAEAAPVGAGGPEDRWGRPGCPDSLPQYITDIAYEGSGPRFVDFVPERCIGNGLVEGPAVDAMGSVHDLTLLVPGAPGAEVVDSDGTVPKPRVVESSLRTEEWVDSLDEQPGDSTDVED